MNKDKRYSLDELATLTGVNRRTVRYYIQQGLLDRPEGAKRGAYYTQRHLEQLLEIRKWQRAGLSLERIRELLAGPEGVEPPPRRRRPGEVSVLSHIHLGDGLTLVVDPEAAHLSPEQIRALAREISAALERLQQGGPDHATDGTPDDPH